MLQNRQIVATSIGLMIASASWAADPFSVAIVITDAQNQNYAVYDSGSSAEELIERLDPDRLRALVETQYPDRFSEADVIRGYLNFRGVDIEIGFPERASNSAGTQLEFSVDFSDGLFERTFLGNGTRSSSVDELKEFMKANGEGLLTRLQQEQAKSSPTDPIAGNPGSAQSMSADRDFDQGFTHKVSQVWGCGTSARSEQIMLAKAGFACSKRWRV